MNHQEALTDYSKFKEKVIPNIDEDSILISSYFTEEEKYKIKEVFQDYYHMDIEILAEHNKTLDTLFKKLGIIYEPYIINTIAGKSLVLASTDLYYKVRLLDWTEETIEQMGGLDNAWIRISKDQIIKE